MAGAGLSVSRPEATIMTARDHSCVFWGSAPEGKLILRQKGAPGQSCVLGKESGGIEECGARRRVQGFAAVGNQLGRSL